jgi:hypothetical protein
MSSSWHFIYEVADICNHGLIVGWRPLRRLCGDPLNLRDVMPSAIAQVALLHSESKTVQDEVKSFNMTLPSRNFSPVVVQ